MHPSCCYTTCRPGLYGHLPGTVSRVQGLVIIENPIKNGRVNFGEDSRSSGERKARVEETESTRGLWAKVPTDGPGEHAWEGLTRFSLEQLSCGEGRERQQAGWLPLTSLHSS